MDVNKVEISEDEFLITPIHDTGSGWYKFISFVLPVIGLLLMLVFKHFNHKRNAKACKKGAVAGLITIGVILLLFLIMLMMVVW